MGVIEPAWRFSVRSEDWRRICPPVGKHSSSRRTPASRRSSILLKGPFFWRFSRRTPRGQEILTAGLRSASILKWRPFRVNSVHAAVPVNLTSNLARNAVAVPSFAQGTRRRRMPTVARAEFRRAKVGCRRSQPASVGKPTVVFPAQQFLAYAERTNERSDGATRTDRAGAGKCAGECEGRSPAD